MLASDVVSLELIWCIGSRSGVFRAVLVYLLVMWCLYNELRVLASDLVSLELIWCIGSRSGVFRAVLVYLQ